MGSDRRNTDVAFASDTQDELHKVNIDFIQARLHEWHLQNSRSFPWRATQDPFAVLIAEKLLQQTSAQNHVVLAYQMLRNMYPQPKDLASADEADVMKIIGPLGLHYRAQELIALSREISEAHDGIVPDSLNDLLKLPGIGSYCARSVLCFAYGRNVAIVDTNTARFFKRILDIPGDLPANPARNKHLLRIASEFLPRGKAREFNFALLDFCAKVCTSRSPSCGDCPIFTECRFSGKAR